MTILRTLSCALLVLLGTATVFGQAIDWNMTGAGARAEALGGAFIGLADDATAIVWNPGGLAQLERAEASVVGRFLINQFEFKYPQSPTDNATVKNSHPMLNFGSLAIPFHAGRFTFVPAVAYQRQMDFYYEFDGTLYKRTQTGGATTITPGFGFSFIPVLKIGAAMNLWGLGSLERNDTGKPPTTTGLTEKNTFDLKGTNFVFGVLIDLDALKQPIPLKIGATVRTPFDLEYDGEMTRTGPWPSGFALSDKWTGKVQIPLMLGGGASFRIGESFTIAADFETRMYGDKYEITQEVGQTPDSTRLSDSKKDLNQVRVGAEYLIVLDIGVIPIRAGFKTVPTLFADYDKNNKPGGQVSGIGFSVGTGFIADRFALDLALSRSSFDIKDDFAPSTSTYTYMTLSGSLIVYF
jgi:hypothetical protein